MRPTTTRPKQLVLWPPTTRPKHPSTWKCRMARAKVWKRVAADLPQLKVKVVKEPVLRRSEIRGSEGELMILMTPLLSHSPSQIFIKMMIWSNYWWLILMEVTAKIQGKLIKRKQSRASLRAKLNLAHWETSSPRVINLSVVLPWIRVLRTQLS